MSWFPQLNRDIKQCSLPSSCSTPPFPEWLLVFRYSHFPRPKSYEVLCSKKDQSITGCLFVAPWISSVPWSQPADLGLLGDLWGDIHHLASFDSYPPNKTVDHGYPPLYKAEWGSGNVERFSKDILLECSARNLKLISKDSFLLCGLLFTQLIVSFAIQEFYNFMRSTFVSCWP